jgi:hypothetical protein
MTSPVAASYTIEAPYRAGGLVTGVSSFHLSALFVQVSENGLTLLMPPKRTMLPVALS